MLIRFPRLVLSRALAVAIGSTVLLLACSSTGAPEGAGKNPNDLPQAKPPRAPGQGAPVESAAIETPQDEPAASPEFLADFADWRDEREFALQSPEGYLGLAGMYWLAPGEHVVGSGPDCDIELPAGRAPERVGTLTVRGETVSLAVDPGVRVMLNGKAVESAELTLGESQPLRVRDLSFWLIERAGQLGIRLRDPESPVLTSYQGTTTWPPRESWRVPARFKPYGVPRDVRVPNVLGSYYEQESSGVLQFTHGGREHSLTVTGGGSTSLFVIFGDASNGRGSYSGGRFLAVAMPDEDGMTTLDFNRAYNPPCAYSPFTTCPLPPSGNELPFAVKAGEQVPKGH